MLCAVRDGSDASRCHASPAHDARLPSDSDSKQNPRDPWFLAVAPVHPRCSRRLRRFSLSRLACSRRAASLRLRLETESTGFLVSRRCSGPSALFATAQTLLIVTPRLLTTRGFPPTPTRNRIHGIPGFSPSLRSIRAVRDGSDDSFFEQIFEKVLTKSNECIIVRTVEQKFDRILQEKSQLLDFTYDILTS